MATCIYQYCGHSFQSCFTSADTIRLIRDGEPRTATSTFTQLLSSERQWFNVTLHPQIPSGLLGMGSQGLPPQLSHSSWAPSVSGSLLLNSHRNHKNYSGQGVQHGHLDFHTTLELWWEQAGWPILFQAATWESRALWLSASFHSCLSAVGNSVCR